MTQWKTSMWNGIYIDAAIKYNLLYDTYLFH